MQEPSPSARSQTDCLADNIADGSVKRLFLRFVDVVSQLHDDVRVRSSDVETRIFYGSEFICRLVPYRELFHVQIGDTPAWETRVRSAETFFDTVDMALQRYLDIYAARRPAD